MTTNQAFIKAFRQDAAQPAPNGPAIGSAPLRQAPGLPSASVEHALTATVEYIAAPNAVNVFARSAQPASGVSSTAFDDASLPSVAGSPRRTTESTSIARSRRVDAPTSNKRPLSSFTAQTRQRPTPPARDAAFEPGTKVANFRWPGVCRTLLREHGQQYDQLADLLLAGSAKRTIIGMLGLFPGSGCTTTLLCAAARLAGRGRRVIIVDGNFVAPQLAQWLDVQATATWQDVLAGGAPVADAVVRATADNLDLLPLSSNTRDALELASGRQASHTTNTLRGVYDLVLVDLGAFFDAQSQPTLLELVRNLRIDAALAVVGPKAADPRDLATLAQYLGDHRCELLGTIESRISERKRGASPVAN